MLTLKTKLARVARPCLMALGVPLAVSACEIELQRSGSSDDGDFGDDRVDYPGASTRRESPSPILDERLPSVTAPSTEEYWDGPGISTYLELVVLDPSSVHGAHAANADRNAPWSFRAQMAWLAGSDTAALAFSVRWLDSWQSARAVGTARAPVSARPALRNVLLRPWLGGAEPEPVSDFYDTPDPDVAPDPGVVPDPYVAPASASAPDSGVAPDPDYPAPSAPPDPYAALPPSVWGGAPFRLLAIVNRVDLARDACGADAGELRYVYTATEAESEQALDLSVIIEIPYPRSRSAAGWARAWRDVASLPAGSTRDAALVSLTREVAVEADPLRARVRTNEAALAESAGPWQMREFELSSSSSGALDLMQVPLALTPRADADLGQLAEHLLSHADEVLAGGAELPDALRAGAAEMPAASFSWRVPGISERLRSAFSGSTCNGCHAGDTETERFQHIAPRASASAPARLSRFLYDESAPTDELRRRQERLEQLAATNCPGEVPPSGRYY